MTQYQEEKRLKAIERLHDVKYEIANMMCIHFRDDNPKYNDICRQLANIEQSINKIAKEIEGE